MNICVIGTGYVGLVTGTCLAEFGMNLTCVDNDEAKIRNLNQGRIPIYEPGLEDLIRKNVEQGRLRFTTELDKAVPNSLVVFITVGTPPNDDGSSDLRHVESVAKEISKYMNGYKVIVLKSTVPIGTCRWVKEIIRSNLKEPFHFDIVSNPEFQREGSAIEDFMRPDRVTIGAESEQAVAIMQDIYSALYLNETPFVITNLETAEMIKYASNAFLATKISFINEIANLCEKVGADVHHVARAMGLDGRIGRKFLHPGPGFGGSCFPKDTRALAAIGEQRGEKLGVIQAVIEANDRQRQKMVEKIKAMVGDLKGKTIGILGLSFKPNTDDIRESASIAIIKGLQREGASVKTYDPAAMEAAGSVLEQVEFCPDPYQTALDCDALVLVTEWNEFRRLDLARIKKSLKQPIFVDLRNVYETSQMKEMGFLYCGVGR
ncbi:MAG: UDP-glucose/GDP-mannose dehydrogenase family protein [Deltaproteobacteria bacterium]|nr:UDP-glucose/GDP-mannose dehydrogenase family protein [Deltaproteobacteria bacterium]MBW2121123.1 UDP-glucose/GDP-mannose dehydrogenase family protein [Deltaproteobacteria bacterium]